MPAKWNKNFTESDINILIDDLKRNRSNEHIILVISSGIDLNNDITSTN